jgi:hypothetical protein
MIDSSGVKYAHTNHLIDENSPYLLSHAHNPVDWYPWGEKALAKATAENKPIFLSIGYAACHWCHVMERESFENDSIAAVLNEYFVSIKVDREQRPDLDHIYMSFTQAMSGQGGWPMSVFLTPDLKPFFAGTYFPPQDIQGRPGFMRVITEISRAYQENRQEVVESAEAIFEKIEEALSVMPDPALLSPDLIDRGAQALMNDFDHTYGGFGTQPKFPHAVELSLLLRQYRRSGDLSYLQAAEKALAAMARGGIYDQLGGGFARYATDARWLVPHFEKMLYDNGLLVTTYIEAYQVTGDDGYLETIRGTLDWLLREMVSPEGGFYSSLDADSEGEEGKFYVWSADQIRSSLGDKAQLFMAYYNVTEKGNFEGHNILNLDTSSERVKQESKEKYFDRTMAECRARLLAVRNKRVRPATDDKILTSWNGLALSALCRGYQMTGEKRYLEAARRNAAFVQSTLWRDGMLTHSYREGNHSDGQFLEDYGYYVRGLIDLYESDPDASNEQWQAFARQLALRAVTLFADDSHNLYLRPADQSDLILRPKDEYDGALPAPGSILIASLFRLGRSTGDPQLTSVAEKTLRAVSGSILRGPNAMTSALQALDFQLSDKIEMVVVGDGEMRDRMLQVIYRAYLPNRVIAISPDGNSKLPLFEGRALANGGVKVYLCRNSVCGLPVESVAALQEQLNSL